MDLSLIGRLVADYMEQLERDWPDDATVMDCVLVVEIEHPNLDQFVMSRCSDRRWRVHRSLVEEALESLDAIEVPTEDPEDV